MIICCSYLYIRVIRQNGKHYFGDLRDFFAAMNHLEASWLNHTPFDWSSNKTANLSSCESREPTASGRISETVPSHFILMFRSLVTEFFHYHSGAAPTVDARR